MGKIVLISCVSKKLSNPVKASDLYVSSLFKKNLAYAKKINPDKIYILSAKYGLLSLDQVISPYNVTLNTMKNIEIKKWSEKVLVDLKKVANLETDEIIFLAGIKYRKYLIPNIKNFKIPMEGLSIGKQLRWLKAKINE